MENFCSVGGVSWKGAPLFGLDGNVPLSRAWFSGSCTRILYKNVKDGYKKSTFVIPTIFSKNSNSVFENGMDQGYKIISLVIRNEQLLSLFMRPCAL